MYFVLFFFLCVHPLYGFMFKDHCYSFEALRVPSCAVSGGADINECLQTAHNITEGDDESWYTEWHALATRVEKEAINSENGRYLSSAKSQFFRAANYYRAAEFFLHDDPNDPRIIPTWEKGVICFARGAQYNEYPIIPVKIPFEGTTLPGYLCLADKSGVKRSLVIVQTGFDGTKEELYFTSAFFALKRGYNCLLFEGPGQGEVLRKQRIPFRYNWETVITPVVDYALSQSVVDPNKIVLMGLSMGGYLVPRALAFEHRVRIGIANGGVFDFHQVCMRGPPSMEQDIDDPEASQAINAFITKQMKHEPGLRWFFCHGMYAFGVQTPSELLRMTRPYTLKDVITKIRTRMLIVDSEDDREMPGQSRRVFDALTCPKSYILFTRAEAAAEHCQVGAYALSNERIFNWLDENL